MSKKPREIQISNAELSTMVRDLDELNQDVAMPAMAEACADLTESVMEERAAQANQPGNRLNRRSFLLGAGALTAGGVALAACGGSKTSTTTTSTTPATSAQTTATDLAITALATALENQAVATYGAAVSAVLADKFGNIPTAATNFALIAKSQHAAHAQAWNQILVSAGKPQVTGGISSGPYTDAIVNSKFATIVQKKDLVALLELALALEDQAAQTYQVGSFTVTAPKGIQLAASIQPVEMQHVAILYFVLGKYPGAQDSSGKPISFEPTSSAAQAGYYTGPI